MVARAASLRIHEISSRTRYTVNAASTVAWSRSSRKWVSMFSLIFDSVAICFICHSLVDRACSVYVDLHYRESEIRKLFRCSGKSVGVSCFYRESEISEIEISQKSVGAS